MQTKTSSRRTSRAKSSAKSSFKPRSNSKFKKSNSSKSSFKKRSSSSSSSSRGPSKFSRNNKFSKDKKRTGGYKKDSKDSGYKRKGASKRFERSNSSRNSRGGDRNRRGQSGRSSGRRMPTFDPSNFIKESKTKSDTSNEIEEKYEAKNTFNTFGLDEKLAKTIEEIGMEVPSPIQDQIIPEILNGRDVIGLAETGTGKTAAFLIPILDKTIKERESRRTTLILAPTRELAIQIEGELKKLAKEFRIYSTVCVGGANIRFQIKQLGRRNHFIIGTPGRVLDLIKRGNLKTNEVTTVVLDEADQMLDMGFIHDMRAILSGTPKTRETLFFSATTTKETDRIVNDFLNDPITVSVKKKDVTSQIEQDVITFARNNKFETLLKLLAQQDTFKKVLIFGEMKHSVKKLAEELNNSGIKAESIHGNKSHSQRQKSLKKFKESDVQVLVATDVAARGIHVDEVTHVINYDLPATFQDYVHRIGRTGRGSHRGKALTFIKK